jgi:hypothetical protein
MARIATAYHNFRRGLKTGALDRETVVKTADEELALVIDTLPDHLQPDHDAHGRVQELEESQPWIKWQRYDITVVLLHCRLRINRTLQSSWLESPGDYAWARAVSIQSSLDLIWISRNWDQPLSMRKQWFV